MTSLWFTPDSLGVVSPRVPRHKPLLTSTQVTRLVGISYRILDYWCRTGLVNPAREADGSGYPRGFDEVDLRRLQAVKRARDVGLSFGVIRSVLDASDEGVDNLQRACERLEGVLEEVPA